MQQQTVPINPDAGVLVHAVQGDLRVAGWERNELMAKTSGGTLDLASGANPLTVSCDDDLILYLPHASNVKVDQVSGDASLQALGGPVTLGPVAGDLTVKDLGPLTLGTVSGDASLRNIGALNAGTVSGDFTLRRGGVCAVKTIGGDASIRDMDGTVTIENVASDLYVRNVHAAVNVKAGGDVALYLEPLPGRTYDITAGGELILRLSPQASVKLHLTGGSPDSIHVDFPGVTVPEDCVGCEVVIGAPAAGMPEMLLAAGGDLLVTSQADSWESAADFGVGMRDGSEWSFPPFELPEDFSERINQRVKERLERTRSRLMDVASRQAENAGRRTSIKIEAAMRRAEAKAHAAEVRSRRGHANVHVGVGRWNWDVTPHGPVETSAPVSDGERLAILKMLQEKKITVEEAEKLLAALEGK